MTDTAVRVDSIGKQYRLGMRRTPGTVMLREALTDLATAPFRKLRRIGQRLVSSSGPAANAPLQADHFWALRNVSFSVPRASR